MLLAAAEEQQQIIDVDRLLHEVLCAQLHRLDRVFDRAERGHHDDRTIGIALARLLEHGDAISSGQAQIRQHREVPPPLGQTAHGVAAVRADIRLEAFQLDSFLEHHGERLFVLDDQQALHRLVGFIGRSMNGSATSA